MTIQYDREDSELILRQPHDGYVSLALNRPSKLNALTTEMMIALRGHLEDCRSDSEIRTVILTGSGRGFCAGQDLNDRDPRTRTAPLDLEAIQKTYFHPIVQAIRNMEKPVITAVNGIAAGAGSSLALAGDIVIAARSAKFAQSFSKVGLSVDAGGGWQLVKALGPARARALLLTGGIIDAAEAEQLGLIWKSVDETKLLAEAHTVAGQFAKGPAVAYTCIKKAVAAATGSNDFDDYLAAEAKLQGIAGRTQDYREGVLSFLENRPAKFSGK